VPDPISHHHDEYVESMRTLCAGLAHGVRNPLNSATLQLELAARRARRNGDSRLVEPIALATFELERLTMLLDELLAFARPTPLDVRPHDLAEIVHAVVDSHRSFAEQQGVALVVEGGDAPLLVAIDATKVRQLLAHLVNNAIEGAPRGGRCTISVDAAADRAHLVVADDGPGIAMDALPRIYEPFFSTKDDGTGMGLSIVYSLVALQHGAIDVSTSARGTTFDVAIPIRH